MSVYNSLLCPAATVEMSCLQHCSTNGNLHILVKAQPSTTSTWPLTPTRLDIWLRDLGLPNEYTLGHCGLSPATRHKLASKSRYYSLLIVHDTTAPGLYLYHNLPILQIHKKISYHIGRTDTDTDIHSWLYQSSKFKVSFRPVMGYARYKQT